MTNLLVLNYNLSRSRGPGPRDPGIQEGPCLSVYKSTLNFSHKHYLSTSTKSVKRLTWLCHVNPLRRLTKKEREKIGLTDREKEVLVGLLLGDAHIEQRSSTGNSRLRYTQTIKHDTYFNHVFDLFKKYCSGFYCY